MKVGIIGSGDVGQALGAGFVAHGHQTMLGSRDPNSAKVQGWRQQNGAKASAGTFDQVAAFGDLIVLATAWGGTEQALKLADLRNFVGKVVIDVTNPLNFPPNAPPELAVGFSDSGGEQVQRWLPESRVVKAFNIVGSPLMINPRLPGGPPTMFICGNDEYARQTVNDLCETFGWEVEDVGGIEASRLLEPLALLWVTRGLRSGQWNHAFKLLKG